MFKKSRRPISEIGLEPEIKSKLIIPPEVKKLDVIREEVIPSSPEEMSVEEGIIEEKVSAPEEMTIEEAVIEEEIVSAPEEISIKGEVVEEETIDEAPKIEIFNCQFCGKELSSDMIFCLQCGHKVRK